MVLALDRASTQRKVETIPSRKPCKAMRQKRPHPLLWQTWLGSLCRGNELVGQTLADVLGRRDALLLGQILSAARACR
jgi:hypothetical protein